MKKSLLFLVLSILAIIVFGLSACSVVETPPASTPSTDTQGTSTPAATSAPAVSAYDSSKADVVIRFAHNDAEGDLLKHKYYVFTSVFQGIIEAKTNGRICVEVFPNSQLGDLPSMLEQMQQGLIQVAGGQNTGLWSGYYSGIQCLDIPYAFPSVDVAMDVLNGEFGDKLNANLIENGGFRCIAFLPTSFRNFITKGTQIRSAADLAGMKIRVMEAPIYVTMVESLGASTTIISFAELYSAMQTGVVDGHEQAPYTVLQNNLQEVADYYTIDGHLLNSNGITMNEKFFQSLAVEDQELVLYAARQAQLAMMGIVQATETADLGTIAAAGVEVYYPTDEELATFRDATQQPVIDMLIRDQGVEKAIIDEMFAAIDASQARFASKTNPGK